MAAINTVEESASGDHCKFKILLDTGTEDNRRLFLLERWLDLWCQSHCSGLWEVTQNPDRTKDYQIVIRFSDPREAVHFKLVSGSMYVREKSEVSHFIIH